MQTKGLNYSLQKYYTCSNRGGGRKLRKRVVKRKDSHFSCHQQWGFGAGVGGRMQGWAEEEEKVKQVLERQRTLGEHETNREHVPRNQGTRTAPLPASPSHPKPKSARKQRRSKLRRKAGVGIAAALWGSLSEDRVFLQHIMLETRLSLCLNKQFNQQPKVSFYHPISWLDGIIIFHLLTAGLLSISWSKQNTRHRWMASQPQSLTNVVPTVAGFLKILQPNMGVSEGGVSNTL